MTTRERFAQDHNIDIDRVGVIVRLADECARLNELYCNGDPHPRNPDKANKARSSELWGNAVDVATADLLRYAETYGFTAVDFSGLRPSLKRGERWIEIPA